MKCCTINGYRDAADLASLSEMGWSVMAIWERETKQVDKLKCRLARFLGSVVLSSFEYRVDFSLI